jgi:hypothetical protein
MDSPADDEPELAAAFTPTDAVICIVVGLGLLLLGLVTRPPRWLLAEPDDHVVNGNGNGHGPAVDADTLARAES